MAIPRKTTTRKAKPASRSEQTVAATVSGTEPLRIHADSLSIFATSLAQNLESVIGPLTREIEALRSTVARLNERLEGEQRSPVPTVSDQKEIPTSQEDADCLVPKCRAPVLAKQLCETHYRVMRRSLASGEDFNPNELKPARVKNVKKHCQYEDCDEAHYAKGLCRRHYMAARSRIRAAERLGAETEDSSQLMGREESPANFERPSFSTASLDETRPLDAAAPGNGNGRLGPRRAEDLFDEPRSFEADPETLPTAEMVSRVVAQYRGGLDRVAEVLGRNKRTLIDLLDHLNLMPYVAKVREAERQRVEAASLRERLDDLLFREKLLEDLGCLKDVDDRARFEVKKLAADLTRDSDTVDAVLNQLAIELDLEEAGMKRLIWRYDLRRYLRSLGLRTNQIAMRGAGGS